MAGLSEFRWALSESAVLWWYLTRGCLWHLGRVLYGPQGSVVYRRSRSLQPGGLRTWEQRNQPRLVVRFLQHGLLLQQISLGIHASRNLPCVFHLQPRGRPKLGFLVFKLIVRLPAKSTIPDGRPDEPGLRVWHAGAVRRRQRWWWRWRRCRWESSGVLHCVIVSGLPGLCSHRREFSSRGRHHTVGWTCEVAQLRFHIWACRGRHGQTILSDWAVCERLSDPERDAEIQQQVYLSARLLHCRLYSLFICIIAFSAANGNVKILQCSITKSVVRYYLLSEYILYMLYSTIIHRHYKLDLK